MIAWQAVMLDALRLTGDPTIADDLELATLTPWPAPSIRRASGAPTTRR